MRRTILLADDSPTIRRLVTQTFADANFRIVEVNNGDAAIKSFEEVRPNVVLADIYMPGKNGYQVCAYVRNHATLSRTPVVLLVGAFDAFDGVAAKQAGATASITKPFEPTALIDLVQSVMSTETETAEPPAPAPARTPPPPVSLVTPAPSPAASRHPLPEGGGGERGPVADPDDLLGLQSIFRQEPQRVAPAMTEDDIDRIADRVIQRLSTQVIESIAWDIVPDITEKIVREEMKRVK